MGRKNADESGVTLVPASYFGGKWDMYAQHLKPFFPELETYETYAEHCGGMAGIMLQRPAAPVEVYNDVNSDLCNFFRVCREHPAELAAALELTPVSREEWERSVAAMRDAGWSPATGTAPQRIERARQLIIVLRQSLSAAPGEAFQTCKKHSRRGMASNCSAWLNMPESVRQVGTRFAQVQIENLPAWDCLAKYDHDKALHYLDPPYFPGTCQAGIYEKAGGKEMTVADHTLLLDAADECEGTVLISGYDCPEYHDRLVMRAGFEPHKREVPCRSSVSTTGSLADRTTRTEMVWARYAAGMRPKDLPHVKVNRVKRGLF